MCSNFTYIIAYRDSPDRQSNLFLVLDWLKKLDCEVILVEQDAEKKLKITDPKVKHIFTYSNRLFNRSWAFNVGSRYATYDKLVFGDADIILSYDSLCEALLKLESISVVSPYQEIFDLTYDETVRYSKNKTLPDSSNNIRSDINLSGGVIMINRTDFELICGWCEEFEGWGGEDDFMTWKIDAWLTSTSLPYNAFHLWHPATEPDEVAYETNLNILRKCEQLSTEKIVHWILDSKYKIGNPNKFK